MTRPPPDTLRCNRCGDVIGVYEPVVVVIDGTARQTARAAEPRLSAEHGEHYHRACYLEQTMD